MACGRKRHVTLCKCILTMMSTMFLSSRLALSYAPYFRLAVGGDVTEMKMHINRHDGDDAKLVIEYRRDYASTLEILTKIIDQDIELYRQVGISDLKLTTENNRFFLKNDKIQNEYYID